MDPECRLLISPSCALPKLQIQERLSAEAVTVFPKCNHMSCGSAAGLILCVRIKNKLVSSFKKLVACHQEKHQAFNSFRGLKSSQQQLNLKEQSLS